MLSPIEKYGKSVPLTLHFWCSCQLYAMFQLMKEMNCNGFVSVICSTLTQTLILKIQSLQRLSLMLMMKEQQKLRPHQ